MLLYRVFGLRFNANRERGVRGELERIYPYTRANTRLYRRGTVLTVSTIFALFPP